MTKAKKKKKKRAYDFSHAAKAMLYVLEGANVIPHKNVKNFKKLKN